MTIKPDAAAKYLAKLSGYTLSNLKLQKLLYLADMAYTGTKGERLVSEDFEAWDYGPVLPSVYHMCKYRGSKPITEAAFLFADDLDEDSPEADMLRKVWQVLKDKSPGELVQNTHWCKGAWHKRYVPGAHGIKITTEDMREEWQARNAERNTEKGKA